VVNKDSTSPHQRWSQYLIGNLTSTQILRVQSYTDNQTAQSDLTQGKIQAAIIIPERFGESCESYWKAPGEPSAWVYTTLELYLDSGSMFATQAIPPIIEQALATTVYGAKQTSAPRPIVVGSPSLIQAAKLTTFDYMAPGIFPFAAIFLVMMVAQSFTLDRERGLLRRISVTPTTPIEFMTSHALSNMITAVVQVAITFLAALLVGYRPKGDTASFVLAFVIMSIFALCCVGFGLISATLSKSPGAATGIAFLFILPMMFLGTYVTGGLAPGVQAAGRFVPSYYAYDALTSLFLRGAPVWSPTIIQDLAVVSIYSIVVLLLGVLLFRKYGRV